MLDFNLLLRLNGFPMSKAKHLFQEISHCSNSPEWIESKKWEIFHFHNRSNSSYRHFVNHPPQNWNDIPIISKEDFRQGVSILPDFSNSTRYYKNNTSGSTGQPLVYATDFLNHALTWQLIAHRYQHQGLSLNDLQARFYGMPLTFPNQLKETIKDWLGHRHRFPVMDLSEPALEKWVKYFKKSKFKYLYGYSYPITIFATYLQSQNISLKSICPTLKACILTAEMCSKDEQSLIESVMGIPVANEYGASEIGIIGFGTTNQWVASQELIFIEIVDDLGQLVKDGEMGRIICTPLFNKGTPFIRYEVGDLGRIEKKGTQTMITELIGRKEEMAILPSGKKVPGDTAFYYIFKEFSKKNNLIKEYKVTQHQPNDFEIQIISDRELTPQENKLLYHFSESYLEKRIRIEIIRVDFLDRTISGKFRRFVSKIQSLDNSCIF